MLVDDQVVNSVTSLPCGTIQGYRRTRRIGSRNPDLRLYY